MKVMKRNLFVVMCACFGLLAAFIMLGNSTISVKAEDINEVGTGKKNILKTNSKTMWLELLQM